MTVADSIDNMNLIRVNQGQNSTRMLPQLTQNFVCCSNYRLCNRIRDKHHIYLEINMRFILENRLVVLAADISNEN